MNTLPTLARAESRARVHGIGGPVGMACCAGKYCEQGISSSTSSSAEKKGALKIGVMPEAGRHGFVALVAERKGLHPRVRRAMNDAR